MRRLRLRILSRLRAIVRWRYILPRAIVVVAMVLAVRFGLDPLLRWTIVTVGEASLGAKVEVGGLRTSLWGGRLVVASVAAANPRKPMRNLAEAADIRLQVDMKQLLRKRLVVHAGTIRGLAFDSPRATSGALPDAPAEAAGPSALDPVIRAAEEKALGWLDGISGRLQQDLMEALATPKLVDELETRWPEEYQALKGRVEELRAKSKRIEGSFREVKKNPLRRLGELEQLQRELAGAEAEVRQTLAALQAMPARAKADRLAVDAARKQDEQFLRQQLQFDAIDSAELNRYLLGETAHGYLTQASYWIEQARKFIPKRKIEPPARARGTQVIFAAGKQTRCLFERVELAGHARLGGQALDFTGELSDAASDPELHARPLRLTLAAKGAFEGTATVVLDRRGEAPHDLLVVDVPKLMLADRTLGRADKLAIVVAPGEASLKAEIRLDGEALSGVVSLRQASTLAATTPMLRDDRIAQVLHESLAGVDRLEATVHLAGTLKRPNIAIQSNVGEQLAGGVRDAVTRYLSERQERLLAKVKDEVDQQYAKLEAKRQEAEKELFAKLDEQQQLIGQIAALLQGQIPTVPGGLPPLTIPPLGAPQLGKGLSMGQLEKLKR